MSLISSFADWVTERVLEYSTPEILELGSRSFRRISGARQGGRYLLKTLRSVEAPRSLVFSPGVNLAVFNEDEFLETIGRLFPEKNKPRYLAVILPDSAFHMGLSSLPAVAVRGGVQPLVEREVQNTAPLSLQEYRLNFEVGQTRGNKRDLLYSCLPRNIGPEIFGLLETAGLLPISVQPSLMCLQGLLKTIEEENANHPSVFIHIGREITTVGIILGGYFRRIQIIPLGGDSVNRLLSPCLNLPPEEVEELKKKEIILLDEPTSEAQLEIPAYQVLEPYFTDLLQKVYGLLQLHSNQTPQEGSYRRIILSGGGGNLRNLDKLIAENLGLPVFQIGTLVKVNDASGPLDKSVINALAPMLGGLELQFWKTSRVDRMVA